MTKKLPPVFEQKLRAVRNKELRKASKAIADQAQTHRREVTCLALEHLRLKEALAAAVKLLRWVEGGGRGRWTPANSAELEEWERLCK